MQPRFIIGLALLALAQLQGCATVPDSGARASTNTSLDPNVDSAKVAAINNVANARGVKVIWLQYPSKSQASAN